MLRFVSIGLLCLGVAGPSALAAPPGAEWQVPTCRTIVGTPAVSFTTDDGATLTRNPLTLPSFRYTFGIVALEEENVLLAAHDGTILRSTDAGCRWTTFFDAGGTLLRLTRGAGATAFGWGFFAEPTIWRIDAAAGARDPDRVQRIADLPAGVLTVRVDPADGDHVLAVASDAQIYEAFDGGVKWGPAGVPAPTGDLSIVYFAVIDPADPRHAIVGLSRTGVWTTFDAGATWTQATGLSATDGPRNAFSGSISAAAPGEVFVMSLDLDESDAGAPSQGRHIYRSADGGLSFAPVVDQGGAITLTNGPLVVAHPTLPGVVYFTFGSRFSDPPGAWLYRYDHAAGGTTYGFTTDYVGLDAIEFNPADPRVIYLGLQR